MPRFVSPAELIQRFLVAAGVGSATSGTSAWKVYRDKQPAEQPDECITVYETTPVQDGRIMRTGEWIGHPGIMLNVRALTSDAAKEKLQAIKTALAGIGYTPVTITTGSGSPFDIVLASFMLVSGPVPLGEDDKNRKEYTLNGTLTIAP